MEMRDDKRGTLHGSLSQPGIQKRQSCRRVGHCREAADVSPARSSEIELPVLRAAQFGHDRLSDGGSVKLFDHDIIET
ncbi:hypothetical protein EU800_23960 [Tropicimonas sp. IMCC6043]|nr:hypothetical protein EU800_23960 [Tropicimonas sp. IMCC6043]